MDVKRLIQERPHLESPISFYLKVREYLQRCVKEEESIQKEGNPFSFVVGVFCSVFDIPEGTFSFLSEEVSEKGIDPITSPSSLLRIPIYHENLKEDDKNRLLFLLSKPFFMLLKKDKEGLSFMENGRCPVCGEVPSVGRITAENRKKLICTFCETEGDFYRIGCPYCMNRESPSIDILLDEEEIRVELCGRCKSYIKSMREEHLKKYDDPHLIDIISLPLDIVTQKRGYKRRSPNIIGIAEIK